MSKSLNRVKAAMTALGLPDTILETGLAKTAQMAADEVGCHVDQIGKSIIFQGASTGEIYLFLTAGGNSVDSDKAARVAGESMIKADATPFGQKQALPSGACRPWVI
ncbi:MAG: Cys-tRNA(Pro)/Cys-tRNA(Cys) deacylase YbaK [Pseudomonadota bacterium]